MVRYTFHLSIILLSIAANSCEAKMVDVAVSVDAAGTVSVAAGDRLNVATESALAEDLTENEKDTSADQKSIVGTNMDEHQKENAAALFGSAPGKSAAQPRRLHAAASGAVAAVVAQKGARIVKRAALEARLSCLAANGDCSPGGRFRMQGLYQGCILFEDPVEILDVFFDRVSSYKQGSEYKLCMESNRKKSTDAEALCLKRYKKLERAWMNLFCTRSERELYHLPDRKGRKEVIDNLEPLLSKFAERLSGLLGCEQKPYTDWDTICKSLEFTHSMTKYSTANKKEMPFKAFCILYQQWLDNIKLSYLDDQTATAPTQSKLEEDFQDFYDIAVDPPAHFGEVVERTWKRAHKNFASQMAKL